jgi:hypothetical protein
LRHRQRAELRSADLAAPAGDAPVGLSVPYLSSFGEDSCGRLFAVSLHGPVYRIVDGALSACGAPDRRACALSARITGGRRVARLRYLSVALRTDEACTARVSAARFRSRPVALAAGTRSIVRLLVAPRALRSLRRGRSLRTVVRVRAVDTAGNVATLTRGVRVKG